MPACILHVDIDAFFASVEQLRNPSLQGRPVAVGAGVVASASYEARRFGLHAGTPLRKARELCPGLVIIPGHAAIYRCFSERLFEMCGEYFPEVETHLDEAYCDLVGTERLYPDPLAVARELKARILSTLGLRVTVGLGRNRMFARLATKSVKPDGLRRILPEEEEAFFAALPVTQLPGVGPRTAKVLEKLNIHTVQELRALSLDSLRRMLGLPGALLHERCRGVDTRPVSKREVPRSIRRETSFESATTDREFIEGALYYLLERAANTLRGLDLEARELGVKIRYADGLEEFVTRRFSEPSRLDRDLHHRAVQIFRSIATRRVALRLVGVQVARLSPAREAIQLEFFGPDRTAEEQESRLVEKLDAIRGRWGHSAIVRGESLHLLGKIAQDEHGFVLRTSCLTR